jgi:hypothetical protein
MERAYQVVQSKWYLLGVAALTLLLPCMLLSCIEPRVEQDHFSADSLYYSKGLAYAIIVLLVLRFLVDNELWTAPPALPVYT